MSERLAIQAASLSLRVLICLGLHRLELDLMGCIIEALNPLQYSCLENPIDGEGSNPHLLHWQVDSLPLSNLGSPPMREEPLHL